MSSLHRINVLGRELQVRSSAPPEEVRAVEHYVTTKLAEVEAAIKGSDPQLVAILTLMNIAEEFLTLVRGNEASRKHGMEKLTMLLKKIDGSL